MERKNFRLVPGKDIFSGSGKQRRKSVVEGREGEGPTVGLPFHVLELNANPTLNNAKKEVSISIKKRWDFLHLFDFLLGPK